MLNTNILPKSLYFSIYGLVYEIPAPKPAEYPTNCSKTSVSMFADWICDYTGLVYKCRNQEGKDYKEMKDFLLSERESFKKFDSIGEMVEFFKPIHVIVTAHREWEVKRYK